QDSFARSGLCNHKASLRIARLRWRASCVEPGALEFLSHCSDAPLCPDSITLRLLSLEISPCRGAANGWRDDAATARVSARYSHTYLDDESYYCGTVQRPVQNQHGSENHPSNPFSATVPALLAHGSPLARTLYWGLSLEHK